MHVLSAGGFIMKSQWDTYEIFPYNPNAFWTNQNAFIPGQEYNMRCHQKKQLEQEYTFSYIFGQLTITLT